jgi:hypothetical protein
MRNNTNSINNINYINNIKIDNLNRNRNRNKNKNWNKNKNKNSIYHRKKYKVNNLEMPLNLLIWDVDIFIF